MLAAIGVGSVDDLFVDVPRRRAWTPRSTCRTMPASSRSSARSRPSRPGTWRRARCRSSSAPATTATIFRPAVDALIQRGEFLTSYTPYQPEVSQGTLQYLFEFQTQVALLTGMEVANASMYDAATATAEAAAMACRVTKRPHVLVSGSVHPHYASTTATTLQYTDHEVEILAPDPMAIEDLFGRISSDTACVVVQNPGFFGGLRDLSPLAAMCHAEGALLVVVVAGRCRSRWSRRPAPWAPISSWPRGRAWASAQFRRTRPRPVRHPREGPAPDAGQAAPARPRTPTAAAAGC